MTDIEKSRILQHLGAVAGAAGALVNELAQDEPSTHHMRKALEQLEMSALYVIEQVAPVTHPEELANAKTLN